MLVAAVEAALFGTNCYVLASGPAQECLVVDPGFGVFDRLEDTIREQGLRPVAVLLTHGHADHVFSVTPVCGARGIPAFIHPDDRYRLTDPLTEFGEARAGMEQILGPLTWTEPDDVRVLHDGEVISLAGIELVIDHAPGHTEGSVMFRTPAPQQLAAGAPAPVCLSGDVLFAGSIGRTDLSGGDQVAMDTSLRVKVLPLADDTVVLPGHGPSTTIGRERATNPFLRAIADVSHAD